MSRAFVLAVVLATGVAAAAAVLLLGGDAVEPMPRLNDRGVAANALVEPRQHLFGDAVSARVDVLLDRRRIDPSAVRLRTRFEPYEPGAPVRTERLDTGSLTRLRFTVRLHCLDESCLPLTTGRPFSFPRGSVLADGERVADFEWPEIAVGSRVVPSAPDSGAAAVGRWRVNLSELPAPTYRVAPGVVFGLLAVLAGVLVAGAAALLGMALPRRASVERRLPPLERALALLQAARRGGEPKEERKALDLLALELARRGEGNLAQVASELAWARRRPASDATDRLTERVGELVSATDGPRA